MRFLDVLLMAMLALTSLKVSPKINGSPIVYVSVNKIMITYCKQLVTKVKQQAEVHSDWI